MNPTDDGHDPETQALETHDLQTQRLDTPGGTRPTPGTVPEPSPEPVVLQRPRTVDVGAVLGGLVLLAVATGVGAREVTGTTWDWRWSAAGVLLVSGLCVVVAAVVAAARQRHRTADPRAPR